MNKLKSKALRYKYFDGYNTVVRHRYYENTELIRYIKDEYYGGGDDVYAVRIASESGDIGIDIKTFTTFNGAIAFWNECMAIIERYGRDNLLATLYPDTFGER